MREDPSCERRRLAFGAVYAAAIAWPWGAYGQVYNGQGLFSAALAILTLVLVISWVRCGRPNIPFDLFWPAVLMGGGAAAFWATGERNVAPGVMVGCGAFLLAVFGATNRTLACRALALSSLSAGCVAVLTVLAEFNKVFPTFFAQEGGTVGAGPTCVSDAVILFAWFFFAAMALFLGRRHLAWGAAAWLLPFAAACCGIALFVMTRRLHADLRTWNPNFGALAFPLLPLVLLGLYLVSQAAARVFVLAESRIFCSRTCLGVLLLLFALLSAFSGRFPPAGLCFSFGLIAALGVPRTLRNVEAVTVGWVWLLVVPLLAAHAVILFPGDARDYLRGAQRARKQSGIQDATDYLGLVLRRFPGESRARLELAELELERGQVEAAADTFAGAVRERRAAAVLGPCDEKSLHQFLAKVRQQAEGMAGIPYERCLIGDGKGKEAVTTLKSRVKAGPSIDIDAEPLRRALASLLGINEADADFGEWTASELLAGLKLCGSYCQSVQAPEGIPRLYLPAVLATRPLHDGRMVAVFYPGGQTGRTWRMGVCGGETPGEGDSWWLDAVVDGETGEWYAPLAGSADVCLGDEPRVSLIEDATLDCGPGAGGWAVMCLLP